MNLNYTDKISFPISNIYYESVSSDGYAFLGYAKLKLNLNYTDCYNKMINTNFRLNAKRKIKNTNVFKNTDYVYTLWACIEFLNLLNDSVLLKKLTKKIKNIGSYENGFARYCDTEINYVVPNATSAAALVHAYNNDIDKVKEFVSILQKTQEDGNWEYSIIEKNKIKNINQYEDSFHLSMMVYHLRKIQKLIKLDIQELIENSIKKLILLNRKKLKGGSIGWGIPMLYLATKDLNEDLSKRAYDEIFKSTNSNFRVRALSAFCLTNEY